MDNLYKINSNLKHEIDKALDLAAPFAICPLDGRYVKVAKTLAPYFSEFALDYARVYVECCWLVTLATKVEGVGILDEIQPEEILQIGKIPGSYDLGAYQSIKEIEKTKNHDVKSVEIFVRQELHDMDLGKYGSFVHFGCTSEDINNVSYALLIQSALNEVILPAMQTVYDEIYERAISWANVPMPARTHGQIATPTTFGKEFMVYAKRLEKTIEDLKKIKITAKFNGATGTYAADSVALPGVDWPIITSHFIDELGLSFNECTTQIEPHDYICEICDVIRHFNNILINFDLDMWLYVSYNYLKQVPKAGETGSSTMPHKVNPINFENSEANVWLSNAILIALSEKLPRSRMQRDLSDSATQRNIGVSFGYALQAIWSTVKGLDRVVLNQEVLKKELASSWEVLGEAIQTVMRLHEREDAYDELKELTRGKDITKKDIKDFIKGLDCITEEEKERLLRLEPATYIGYADKIGADCL